MKVLGFEIRRENRNLQNPATPISEAAVVKHLGMDPVTNINLTIDTALGIPALWGAVNFLSGTLAALPLNVFRKTKDGRERVEGGVQSILHDAVNDEMTSFEWRKWFFERLFTEGRALSYIEFGGNGKVQNLFPMETAKTRIIRRNGRRFYEYREAARTVTYDASEVIDVAFFTKSDGISSISPITVCAESLAMAVAVTRYGSKFFQNGGIPPWALIGPFVSAAALERASSDMKQALARVASEGKPWIALPDGHEFKPLGVDPEKSQMVDLQRFMIEQVSRIYSLPPIFVQDLTHGTFTNSEQQDLHLTKHTITRWCNQVEQQLNLKFFGRGGKQYAEFNLDGLLRGDFKTRMEGYAQGIQNGVIKPNEARAMENRPDADGGNELYAQSQIVPLGSGQQQQKQGDPASGA